jgi:hypothetical protein
MIATVSTIAALAYLFCASPDPAQDVEIRSEELDYGGNVRFVGFDEYFDCDAVKEVLNANCRECLDFIVVNNSVTEKGLLPAFLIKMKSIYRYSRVPFRKVQEHWANIFSAPVHIFVFCDNGHTKEEMKEVFSYSNVCFEMVAKSLELSRGFFWMGTMGLIEEQVKDFLNMPKDSHLVATIFFGDQKEQAKKEVTVN